MAKIVQWTPVSNCQSEVELVELSDDGEGGLGISLEEESGRKMQIRVEDVLAYRSEFRELRPKYWLNFDEEKPGVGVFWEIESSSWLAEFVADDSKPDSAHPVRHFIIATEEQAVEFLTTETPHGFWDDSFFGDTH